MVGPSGERERVGRAFLDTPRMDMTFIIRWNLRLKCITKHLKVQRSYKEVSIKSKHLAMILLGFLLLCEQVWGSNV